MEPFESMAILAASLHAQLLETQQRLVIAQEENRDLVREVGALRGMPGAGVPTGIGATDGRHMSSMPNAKESV